MAMLIFYYSTAAFNVPYKLLSGFGVMALSAALYYLKPAIVDLGLNDLFASSLLLLTGLLCTGLMTYFALKPRQSSSFTG